MNSLAIKLFLILAVLASAPLSAATLCASKDAPLFMQAPVPGEKLPQQTSRLVPGKTYAVIRDGARWVLLDVDRVQLWAERQYLDSESSCRTKNVAPSGAAIKSSPTKSVSPPKSTATKPQSSATTGCPCGSGRVCVGPRGGRYCITSGGNKRYGV
jgi:hypothetical protein